MKPARQTFGRDAAEALAIEALGYIASDSELMPRFLALTGIEPSAIRVAAAEPGFLAGVLGFIAAHEPTLVAFAAAAGVNPASIEQARAALPFGAEEWERSI